MSDKGLDEIFRKKLTNRELAFNPANWDAMETMLDADKKPAIFYWWTSAAVVLFGLLTAGITLFQNPILGDDAALPISTTIQTKEKIDLPNNNTQESNTLNSVENIASQSSDGLESSEADILNQSTEAAEVSQEPINSPVSAVNNGGGIVVNQNTNENYPVANVVNGLDQSTDDTEDVSKIAFISLLEKPIPSLGYSVSNTLVPNREYPSKQIRKFQKQQEISMLAGLGAGPSFNGGEASKDWLIGLNYEYRFSFNWSVNAALSYNAKLSPGIIQNSDSIFHSFSPERVITEMENSRLDYIEMPIYFTRTFNTKHQLGLGVYSSVLFNIKTDIKRKNITIKETKESEFSESGLSENFRVFDYGFTSSYSYQFNPSLNLGVQFKYGLSDITVNNTQELRGYHRNISTRLILRYRLF